MGRTTILADDDLLIEAKNLAKQEGRTVTDVIQTALREYLGRHRHPRKLSFIGIGESGETDVSVKVEELLWKKSV